MKEIESIFKLFYPIFYLIKTKYGYLIARMKIENTQTLLIIAINTVTSLNLSYELT